MSAPTTEVVTEITLEFDEAVELLQRAVEEKGKDYVYARFNASVDDEYGTGHDGECLYFHDGQPSCIVGHVMAYKGMTADAFAVVGGEGVGVFSLYEERILKIDHETLALLTTAQQKQDNGASWGEAVAAALDPEIRAQS